MRRLIILFLTCIVTMGMNAQTNKNYTINQKFKFHSLEFLETGTDKLLEEFPEGEGLVINAISNNQEYLIISIPGVHDYYLQIVNKVEDTPEENLKIIMYQGGEKIENLGTYTANVFYVYDLIKNKEVPELIRFEINNSPNIQQFKGVIRLE